MAALEKACSQKQAYGEFESECPCGAQDTFYVGTLKGVGNLPAAVHRHLLESGFRQPIIGGASTKRVTDNSAPTLSVRAVR